MTIGISKEKLKKCLGWARPVHREFIKYLIDMECTELNPWLPIEQAPLNRKIRLVHKGQLGEGQVDSTLYNESDKKYFTHYQELPADPTGD